MTSQQRWSAQDLAGALGQKPPTVEQARVIEAPLDPLLVIAGAGSGKTETMAARVVYLVANRMVEAQNILGLTFTRKAAGELSQRIRQRLLTIAQADPRIDVTTPPKISTYNAYAGGIVADHGLRLGIDPQSELLTEAGRYQLAHHVVTTWAGDLDVDLSPTTMATAVVALAGELAEHGVSVEQAQEFFTHTITALESKAPQGRSKQPRSDIRPYLQRMANRVALLELVKEFQRLKRARSLLDFGDQVRLAAQVAACFSHVRELERESYEVVLLDEYQDTSVAQVELLTELFGGEQAHPVTAVGDPNQAIYGWRGAAAGTLGRFPHLFQRRGEPAGVETLSTAWRNGKTILEVANRISAPLRKGEAVEVPELVAAPHSVQGSVDIYYGQTIEEEINHIVTHLLSLGWGGKQAPTTAVLCRTRAYLQPLAQALQRAQIPHQITGLGGLLTVPEVSDVWAALQVVHDPTRSDCVMRLLTGPTMRIGPQDLAVLHAWARKLAQKGRPTPQPGGGANEGESSPQEDVEVPALIEAVEQPPPPDFIPQGLDVALSAPARQRLQRLATQLQRIRNSIHLPITELVVVAERALGVDIDVLVHSADPNPRKHLDAFISVAASFTPGVEEHGLGGFLSWLEAAMEHERGLEGGDEDPDENVVALMTMHAAKGLEWDAVIVAGMNEGIFPSIKPRKDGSRRATGWLGANDALAYELRGDRDSLPWFDHEHALTHADMKEVNETFMKQEGMRTLQEERRLAYVAFTRAKESLLLTGSFWGHHVTSPRTPSIFLNEAARTLPEAGTLASEPETEVNPLLQVTQQVDWPQANTPTVDQQVQQAAPRDVATLEDIDHWGTVAQLLINERDNYHQTPRSRVDHLSASQVVLAVRDPKGFVTNLRRPIPQPPSTKAQQGTQFHAWVEQHYNTPTLVDWDDFTSAEAVLEEDELQALKDKFLASSWANLTPVALEVDVETTVGGHRIRSRIDAVFRQGKKFHVVDWKTGKVPAGIGKDPRTMVQLQLYRLAWARAQKVAVADVGASFHYVAHDLTVPAPNLGEQEILTFVAEHLNHLR